MNMYLNERERHAVLLRRYLKNAGITQQEFARRIGVKAANITDYLSKKRPIPVKRAKQFEMASNGAITRQDLFPDLFD